MRGVPAIDAPPRQPNLRASRQVRSASVRFSAATVLIPTPNGLSTDSLFRIKVKKSSFFSDPRRKTIPIPATPMWFSDSDCAFTYSDEETSVADLYKASLEIGGSIQDCNIASYREAIHLLPKKKESTTMETCSRAGIMSLWNLALCPKMLCCSIFRVLSRLLGLSPTILKKSRQDGHVQTATHTLPELSQDILMDIFSTLEIPDLVRAGAVCSSWHSAYTTLRNLGKYKLSQTPCLLYTSESAGESVACLYSLVEKRTYRLTLPEPAIRSRFLIGSSHGWLFTVDDRSEMLLVNPITGEQIALPSVITIEHVNPIFNKSGAVEKYEYSRHTATRVCHTPSIYGLCELQDFLQYKAIMFPETSKGSYIVVLIHNPYHQLSFARVGDEKWTWLPPHTHYEDCIYKDGLLYAITIKGEIHAYDLSGPGITMKMVMGENLMLDRENMSDMYIVEAPCGDLLNLWRNTVDDGDIDEPATVVCNTTEIKVDKVDTMEKALVEVKCLHDNVLFLGHNQSLCLSTKEYPHLKANHAYFTDNNALWTKGYKNNRRDIGILDLENNSREELVSHELWSNWPTPVWITPSLGKMKMKLALNKQL